MPNAMRVKLELTGVDRASSRFTAAQHRAEFPRPAFLDVGRDFLRIARVEFDTSGTYSGKRWAPLASSTVDRKRRQHLDPRILVASNALRESLISMGGEHVQDMSRDRIELGSSVAYLQYHQGRGRYKMPARPFTIPHRDRRRWIETLRVYVMEGRSY